MYIELIADGLGFTEGPVWLPDDRVALTSISHGCVYIVDPAVAAGTHRHRRRAKRPGMQRRRDVICRAKRRCLGCKRSRRARRSGDQRHASRLPRRGAGRTERSDVRAGRRLWITDTRGGVRHQHSRCRAARARVYDRVESGDTQQIIDDGPVFINGLGFDRDGSRLLVTATLSSQLLSYAIAARLPAGRCARAGAHLRSTAGRTGWR